MFAQPLAMKSITATMPTRRKSLIDPPFANAIRRSADRLHPQNL
jgi:hypothetical protein